MAEPDGILGEVLSYGARVRTPVYTDELRADDAIDAGIIQIIDSNLSHQARESLHQLGTAIGSDSILEQNPFDGLEDVVEETSPASGVEEIPWTRVAAWCWGPFDLTQDRLEADGAQLRKVVIYLDADAASWSSLRLYAAVTQGVGTPRSESVLAFVSQSATSGRAMNEIALSPSLVESVLKRSRPDGDEYAAQTDLYVWLGWKSSDGSDRVIAATVWESR